MFYQDITQILKVISIQGCFGRTSLPAWTVCDLSDLFWLTGPLVSLWDGYSSFSSANMDASLSYFNGEYLMEHFTVNFVNLFQFAAIFFRPEWWLHRVDGCKIWNSGRIIWLHILSFVQPHRTSSWLGSLQFTWRHLSLILSRWWSEFGEHCREFVGLNLTIYCSS